MRFARMLVPSHVPAAIAAVLAAAAALGLAGPARAGAWVPAPGEYRVEIQSSVFEATTWHDADGGRQMLVGGGRYQGRELAAFVEMGWKKNTAFFFRLPYAGLTRRVQDPAGFSRTETGFSDLTVGFRYKILQATSALSADLAIEAPAGYGSDLAARGLVQPSGARTRLDVANRPGTPTVPGVAQYAPTLGNGKQRVVGTVNWGMPLAGRGFLDLAGGYRFVLGAKDDYVASPLGIDDFARVPANQMLARADLGIWLGSRILAGGRYVGELSTGTGSTPSDEITRHVVGPILLVRIDERLDVFAGSSHTASAENALHTDGAYVGFAAKLSKLDRSQGWLGGARKP